MSYIDIINRFWSIDLEANFTHLEVHLFFKLLEINNRLGWKESFRFPNSRLEAEVGSRQKNLINARQRLIDYKLITYKKGNTRNAGTYQVVSFNPTKESNSNNGVSLVGTKESNKESNEESNQGNNRKVIRGSLNREDKDKNNTPKSPKSKKEFDLSFVSTPFKDLVREFIRYRRQDIKKPFKTERGVVTFYNKLIELSNNNYTKAKELVDHAKGREWQSVYPIKTEPQKSESKITNKNINDLWNSRK